MTRTIRLLTLVLAAAVNGAALAAVHAAMVQTTLQERLAQQQPARILVTAPPAVHAVAATQHCPAPKVL
jgi:hypothetical protein